MREQPGGRGLALAAALVVLVLVPSSALSARTADAADVARAYLNENAGEHGVTKEDVAHMAVTSSYTSEHNGVTHVNLNQRHQDLEVFGGHITVNVTREGSVLFAAGSLVEGLDVVSSDVKVAATGAAEAAAEALNLGEPENLTVLSEKGGPAQETVLSSGGISDGPISAHLGWQPTDAGLRKAWALVIDASSDSNLWQAIIDADTGALLQANDWTTNESTAQLAQTLSRPAASARQLASSPNPVPDGSSYRVFAHPKESPNDGESSIVQTPADATASPFGWHDTNGAAGAEFTVPRGNNAHGYLDQDANNSADFGEPDGGATLTFDFSADLTQHAQNYRPAAVTNLFYWNNMVHDVMYGFGFTEAAGNFQANNYSRGGVQGDYVRAEAADGGGTNNANFSTPVENASGAGTPRMQMFLWPGNQFGAQNQVVADGVGTFDSSWARFGPAPSVAGTSGQIINAGNGCVAGDYAGAPSGDWMAIVTGGNAGCQNVQKARTAGAAGAKALIVAHSTSAAAPVLTGSLTTAGPTIPAASITQANGNTIRDAIAAGPVTGSVRKHPSHPGIRDGDLDAGIVIHEYGHGISNRLTGGPAVNCLTGNEQAGEGWSDYYAVIMLLDPALDEADGPRGMGPYALFQDNRNGAGIRPRPYSRDMTVQPFTYDSIKSDGWLEGTELALPHGLGHGWAAVLWDMTWDLVDKHGFSANLYGGWNAGGNTRSLQYVTDGLKLQGCGPGLVVSSRAIVAATEALGGEDTCTVWAAFARRGLGYSAVQGTTNRDDNSEAFDTHPDCRRGFIGRAADPPAINVANVGSTVALNFSYPGNQGLDILASGSPYSRQVDCNTLATVTPGQQFITPRPFPVPTETPGGSSLSYDAGADRYTYPWKTFEEWAGTCREIVVTRKDGVQHRAYFRFDSSPSHPVSGHVRDASGNPVMNATVTIEGTQLSPATTDASGFYSFPSVAKGTYTATASPVGAGCNGPQTRQLDVQRPLRDFDFTLPERTDAFGYSCAVIDAPFEEASTPIATLTGDDVTRTIDLPFPVTFYGQTYTRVHVCSNGWIEFVGPTSTVTSFTNTALPTTSRPNGAVYSFWDDLLVDVDASVRTELKGASPNQTFVIEWRNVRFFNDTTRRIDANVVLHENGQIVTQSRNLADDGREQGNSATFGIENGNGTVALQYSFNSEVMSSGAAVNSIRYRPPGS